MPDHDLLASIHESARTDPVWALLMAWAGRQLDLAMTSLETETDPAKLYRLQGAVKVYRRLLSAESELSQYAKER